MGNRTDSLQKIKQLSYWLVALYIFVLPIQTRWIAIQGVLEGNPWEYGTVSLYATDLILCAIIASALFIKKATKEKQHITHIVVLLFLLIAFLSLDDAVNRINGIFWFLQLLKGCALFFAISIIRPPLKMIAAAFFGIGIVQTLFIHAQILLQRVHESTLLGIASQDPLTPGVSVIMLFGERMIRGYGTLPHPNIAGGFLALALFSAVLLFLFSESKKYRFFFGVSILCMSSALFFTFSRQSWIMLATMIFLLMIHIFWNEKKFPLSFALSVILLLLPPVIMTSLQPQLLQTRLYTQERIEEKSVRDRATFLQESVSLIKNHWDSGVGIGNYTAVLHAQDKAIQKEKEGFSYQPVHILYMMIFAEIGIVGIAIFLFFLSTLFFFPLGYRTKNALFVRIAGAGILIVGFFDHYLWTIPVGISLFWIIAGLIAAYQKKI